MALAKWIAASGDENALRLFMRDWSRTSQGHVINIYIYIVGAQATVLGFETSICSFYLCCDRNYVPRSTQVLG